LNETSLGVLFAALALLILISAFFSSSETSMMSLNRYRLKHLKGTGNRGARRAIKLLQRPDRLIGLILIGNNLVNILASAIATVIAIRLFGDAGIAIATLCLTLVILIFAEITPKTIAALHPERVAFPASAILVPLQKIMMPLITSINWLTNGILKMMGFSPEAEGDDSVSQEELRTIVTESASMIPSRHRRMLVNILDLEQMTVNDIMAPRNEIYGIDIDAPDEAIMRQLKNSEHTRLPVYRDDINQIESIFHMRNLSRVLEGGRLNRAALKEAAEAPYFIPENTPLNTQLLHFQRQKKRLGMVVDEYGDILGLVALEDILEEIVGEFTSNLVEENEEITRHPDGSTTCSGTVTIRDLNRQRNWDLPTDGPKTISGLALEALEAFPSAATSVRIEGYQLDIEEIAKTHISRLRIWPIESETEATSDPH
jgi:Mg2+/Co2+ transporter CorB